MKVLIPIVPAAEESESQQPDVLSQAPPPDMRSLGNAGTSAAGTSQSIIIAVADSLEKSTPTSSAVPVGDLPQLEILPDEPVPAPASSSAPRVVQEIETSPADRYVAQRERNRRKQINTAILLLVGVIVLACVLLLVLKFNSGTKPATITMRPKHLTSFRAVASVGGLIVPEINC